MFLLIMNVICKINYYLKHAIKNNLTSRFICLEKNYLLVMEYANGSTLRNHLKENFNNLTWNDKHNLAFQLACAVSCLHKKGIVHRDLVIILFTLFKYNDFFFV